MPYYLFKISRPAGMELVKNLEHLQTFEAFREAKTSARERRAQGDAGNHEFKVIFAESRLSAEEQLLQKREKPVLMEHER